MTFDPSPKERIPEIREMIRLARLFVAKEVHFSQVCSAASTVWRAAKLYSADPAIVALAEEWSGMALRVWPEMARIDNRITEDEFRNWVKAQLEVFEPWTDCVPEKKVAVRSVEQATELAHSMMSTHGIGPSNSKIVIFPAREVASGWVFYYQSALYLETGDFQHCLAGNAPLFVPRTSLASVFLPTWRAPNESIAAYLCCGNANARQGNQLNLTGWQEGAQAVPAIKAIRHHSALGLGAAKQIIDECLGGKGVLITAINPATAARLQAALAELGFTTQHLFSG